MFRFVKNSAFIRSMYFNCIKKQSSFYHTTGYVSCSLSTSGASCQYFPSTIYERRFFNDQLSNSTQGFPVRNFELLHLHSQFLRMRIWKGGIFINIRVPFPHSGSTYGVIRLLSCDLDAEFVFKEPIDIIDAYLHRWKKGSGGYVRSHLKCDAHVLYKRTGPKVGCEIPECSSYHFFVIS